MEQNFKIIDLSDKKQIIRYDNDFNKLKGILIEPNPYYKEGQVKYGGRYNQLPIVDEEWRVMDHTDFEVVAHEGDTVSCTAQFVSEIYEEMDENAGGENLDYYRISSLLYRMEEVGLKVQATTADGKPLNPIIDLTLEVNDEFDERTFIVDSPNKFTQFFFPYLMFTTEKTSTIAHIISLYVCEYCQFFHRKDLRVKIDIYNCKSMRKSFKNLEQMVNEKIEARLKLNPSLYE